MNPRTIATLNDLASVTWFTNVGKPRSSNFVVLSSWTAAIESCSSIEWENLCLEAANQYRAKLVERSPQRFATWNDVVHEVKAVTMPLVAAKIAAVESEHNLPKEFADTVDWDVLHLAMEAEFADVYPAGFYASQAFWYKEGRFPCGWDGAFPKGRLVIY